MFIVYFAVYGANFSMPFFLLAYRTDLIDFNLLEEFRTNININFHTFTDTLTSMCFNWSWHDKSINNFTHSIKMNTHFAYSNKWTNEYIYTRHAHCSSLQICAPNEILMKSAMIDDNEFLLSHVIHGVVLHVSFCSIPTCLLLSQRRMVVLRNT